MYMYIKIAFNTEKSTIKAWKHMKMTKGIKAIYFEKDYYAKRKESIYNALHSPHMFHPTKSMYKTGGEYI